MQRLADSTGRREQCSRVAWAIGQKPTGCVVEMDISYWGNQLVLLQCTGLVRVMRKETEIRRIVAGKIFTFDLEYKCSLQRKSADGLVSDVVASVSSFFTPNSDAGEEQDELPGCFLIAVSSCASLLRREVLTGFAHCSYCVCSYNVNPGSVRRL